MHFKSNISLIRKATHYLKYHKTMSGKQINLKQENKEKVEKAIRLLEEADLILQDVKKTK